MIKNNLFKKTAIVLSSTSLLSVCHGMDQTTSTESNTEGALTKPKSGVYILPHLRNTPQKNITSLTKTFEEYSQEKEAVSKKTNKEKEIINLFNSAKNIRTESNLHEWLDSVQCHFKDDSFKAISFSRSLYETINLHKIYKSAKVWFTTYSQKNPSWLENWFDLSQTTFKDFGPCQFSNTLYALMQLEITADINWLENWYSFSFSKLPDFNAQEYSNTLSSLCFLKETGRLLVSPNKMWLIEFCTHSLKKMNTFTHESYQGCFAGFDALNFVPSDEWLAEFYIQSIPHLPDFTAKDVTTILYGLLHFGKPINEKWFIELEKSIRSNLENYPPKDCSRLISLLADINKRPSPKLMATWYQSFTRNMRLHRPTVKDIVNALYAHARLRLHPQKEWKNLMIQELQKRKDFSDEDRQKMDYFNSFI